MLYTMHLKRMGLVSGIADYCVLKDNGEAMFIEFKRNKKCKLSVSQKDFMELCKELNVKFLMTSDVEQAIDFIKENI